MARKTDVMKAIDKLDAQIAEHQASIKQLETTKQLLADVANEKPAKAKKAVARRVNKASVARKVEEQAEAAALFSN